LLSESLCRGASAPIAYHTLTLIDVAGSCRSSGCPCWKSEIRSVVICVTMPSTIRKEDPQCVGGDRKLDTFPTSQGSLDLSGSMPAAQPPECAYRNQHQLLLITNAHVEEVEKVR